MMLGYLNCCNMASNGKLAGMEEVKQDVKKICRVCSDNASGNHFGVMTCEACKSFFRRSIRASAKYYCNNHNSCVIDKRNRNRCQACRLRKCLDCGMQPDSVQEERAPMSRDVYPSYRIPTPYLPMPGSPMGPSPYPYQFMYTQPMPTTASMTAEPAVHHTIAQQDHSPIKLEQPLTHHITVKPEPPPYPAYNMPAAGTSQNGCHGGAFSPGTALNVPMASFGQQPRQAAGSYPLSLPRPVSSPGQVPPSATTQTSPQTMSQVPVVPAVNGVHSNAPVPVGTPTQQHHHHQQQTLSTVVSTVSEFVDSLPPSLTQSEAFRPHQNMPPQQSGFTYGSPQAMAPPKHIPRMSRWGSQPNLTTTKQEPVLKLQPDISSPHTPGLEAPSAAQDYTRQSGTGGLVHFPHEYSLIGGPTSQPVVNSPTYPGMAQSVLSPQPLPPISDGSFNPAYHPTVVHRNHGSRSSSPTNSIISVGSVPSMRPTSIHSERSRSVSGDHPVSSELTHRGPGNYKDPELPPYSSSHVYRSRSPNGSCASSYSSLSGSRPGSTRSSHYSDHSHSTHSRSLNSAFSGPLTASLNSAHITPPNPHQVYITLDDLLQAEPTLALSPLEAPGSDILSGDELIHMANQTLKQIVNWAKQIQAFISLSQATQMTLMKHCWGELLCFVLAVRSARDTEQEKAVGFSDQAGHQGSRYAFQRMALDLTKWIVERQLDEIELACLKVIILLDPGVQGLSAYNRALVEIIQGQTLRILQQHCRNRIPFDSARYGQIMLRLGVIKKIGMEAASELEMMQALGAEIHDVLEDLIGS